MLKNTGLTIRIDSELKKDFTEFCENAGISVSAAVNLLASASIEHGKIPFEVKIVSYANKKKKGNDDIVRIMVRLEDSLKSKFSDICSGLGIPMSTVIKMFMLQCVEDGKFPFK